MLMLRVTVMIDIYYYNTAPIYFILIGLGFESSSYYTIRVVFFLTHSVMLRGIIVPIRLRSNLYVGTDQFETYMYIVEKLH